MGETATAVCSAESDYRRVSFCIRHVDAGQQRAIGSKRRALANVIRFDSVLVGQWDLMRKSVTGADAQWILKSLPDLEAGIAAIRATLHDREATLMN